MARFYASIKGPKGAATRCGHRGIAGHIRGWNLGVEVTGAQDPITPANDYFQVRVTGGSHGASAQDVRLAISEHSVQVFWGDECVAYIPKSGKAILEGVVVDAPSVGGVQ